MQMDDTTASGWTRRWTLVDGFARCLDDALPPGDPGVQAAIAQNAAIRAMLDLVEPFEAARRVVEPDNGEPKQVPDPDWTEEGDSPLVDNPAWAALPRMVTATDDKGEPITVPDPRWVAYDAAVALIAAASDVTNTLAAWRAGDITQRDAVESAIASAAGTALDAALPQLKAAAKTDVNARCAAALGAGFTVPSGALSGKVLQTRDADDRTNWLTSQAAYSAAVAGGQGATSGASFRTADNTTFTLSYLEGLQVLLAMAGWGASVMANAWRLKDAIAAATTRAALEAIDTTQGWP